MSTRQRRRSIIHRVAPPRALTRGPLTPCDYPPCLRPVAHRTFTALAALLIGLAGCCFLPDPKPPYPYRPQSPGPYGGPVTNPLPVNYPPGPNAPVGPTPFGQYFGSVQAEWEPDGRNMRLLSEFVFVDPRGRRWIAPKGTEVNGASIPGSLWSIVGGPYEGKYRDASVIHDTYTSAPYVETWEKVHYMFYEGCRADGLGETEAKLMYYAVYHFGPRWDDSEIPPNAHELQWVPRKKTNRLTTMQVSLTKEEQLRHEQFLREVHAWIKHQNPSFDELRGRAVEQ